MLSATAVNRNQANAAPYGSAQDRFIKKVRSDINSQGVSFFRNQDWTKINPKQGRNACLKVCSSMAVDAFYVKPVAAWVPHLLIQDHVPTCPNCETNLYVDTTNAKWINKPKVLYGVTGHRYLDTLMYKCLDCNKFFTGYNQKSLELDSAKVVGIFNFHLSCGFAVDDEAYSFITNHSHDATASIYKRLALSVADKYLDDSMFYYKAMTSKKIKPNAAHASVHDRTQKTLDSFTISSNTKTDPNERRLHIAQRDLEMAKHELENRRGQLAGDICFQHVLSRKSNRNNLGLVFKGIGRTKLQKLINHGVTTARELLDYDGADDSFILPS